MSDRTGVSAGNINQLRQLPIATVGADTRPNSAPRLTGLSEAVGGSAKECYLFAIGDRTAKPTVLVGNFHIIESREFEAIGAGGVVTFATWRRFVRLLTAREIFRGTIVRYKQMKNPAVKYHRTIDHHPLFHVKTDSRLECVMDAVGGNRRINRRCAAPEIGTAIRVK